MSDPNAPVEEPLKQLLGRTDVVTRSVQGLLAVSGVFGLLAAEWEKHPYLLFASGVVVALAAAWLMVGIYLRRRRPGKPVIASTPRSTSSYLRGLLPFEQGDSLLGRDQEVGQLLALVRSLEYRFGFLSGEAGAGKTSLLRARIGPELEKAGWQIIYVPRTAEDPELAIRKEILRKVTISDDPSIAVTLVDLLRQATKALPGKTILLVVDQFEEYFVSNRTRQAREALEKTLGEVARADLPVRVLLALRKEFVDDLLDLAKTIPSLGSVQWRLPLRNFAPETAREIIRKIVVDENLRFSHELQDSVVIDLTHTQRVRPVEFQLVFTTLLNQGVFDIAAYRALEGAQGVIARFIGETIEPPDLKISDLERTVARYTLRSLCNKEFTTRRPTGLSRADLVEHIHAQLSSGGQIPATRAEVEHSVDRVLHRFLDGYILILEDEEKYNLTHDYLASPIRDATADVETVEERATRLLDQYLEQQRAFGRSFIPWGKLRYIQKFASPESLTRTEATSLLRRSKVRYQASLAGAAAVLLVIASLLLPFGVRYPVREQLELSGDRNISNDGRVLTITNGKETTILRLDTSRFQPKKLDLAVKSILLSPRGRLALVLTPENQLYQIETSAEPRSEKILDNLGWYEVGRGEHWAGFSADETWAFATAADGRVFAWPQNSRPREVAHLIAVGDRFGEEIDPNKLTPTVPWARQPQPPFVEIVRKGTFISIIDARGRLYVFDPTKELVASSKEVMVLARAWPTPYVLRSSPDGNWLAVGHGSNEISVISLKGSGQPTPQIAISLSAKKEDRGTPHTPNIYLSPDSKWLVARRAFENYHAVELTTPVKVQTFPAIELPRTSSEEGSRALTFSAKRTHVAGPAQNGLVYGWALASPPGVNAKPLLPDVQSPQAAAFCRQELRILVVGADGSVHTATLDIPNTPSVQVGRVGGKDARFRFSQNKNEVLVYDTFRLAFGVCGEAIRNIIEHRSAIRDVVHDTHGNLVVVGERDIVRLDRVFYFWGLPVWRMGWPPFVRDEREENADSD
jgi:hypothetical protein